MIPPDAPPSDAIPLALTVNGRAVQGLAEPRTQLADYLREHLHLTGTHLGCEQGVCGACTVLIDGRPQRTCIAYALDCAGSSITTIEGFDDDPVMNALRTAFSAHHALQCGFCTPGMLITARDIVIRLGDVPERRIRDELAGNLCRCTGYVGIVAAIRAVAAGRPASASPPLQPVASPEPVAASPPMPRRVPAPAAGPGGAPSDAPVGPALTERINLTAAPEAVWAALADLRAVASCLPGAEVATFEDGHITGRLHVALGPIAAAFTGEGTATRDDATRSGRLSGRGRDRGTGSAVEGTAVYTVRPADRGSELDVTLSWRLAGSLAQFARTELVQALARRLLQTFTRNLEAMIAGETVPSSPRPLGLLALIASLIRAWLRARLPG